MRLDAYFQLCDALDNRARVIMASNPAQYPPTFPAYRDVLQIATLRAYLDRPAVQSALLSH